MSAPVRATIATVEVDRRGDDLQWVWREIEDPGRPDSQEVRIRVEAVGISLVDQLMLNGGYEGHTEFPRGLGLEYAGAVVEVGAAEASRPGGLRQGDRVCGMTFGRGGALREVLVLPARDVSRVPEGLDLIAAASLPSAVMTADAALHEAARVRSGERVLMLSGASGVGLAVIQLGVAAGAQVHAAAGPGKQDDMRGLGASEVFDTAVPSWYAGIGPYDVVVDPVGGRGLLRSYDLLAPGGRLVCLDASSQHPGSSGDGTWAPSPATFDPVRLVWDAKTVAGVNITASWSEQGQAAPLTRALRRWTEAGCRPTVAAVVDRGDVSRALALVEQRSTVGRVLVSLAR